MSRLLLAPMEGTADWVLRDILTRLGGYDRTVSEFVRVSGSLLPVKTFLRICPELENASRTSSGTPLRVQLLGSDPDSLAANAARLATLNPEGIDLNFGCPAKTVNRHGGGAMLLDDPVLVERIVAAVRTAVPASIPVSAKMRLGVRDTGRALDCAAAVEAGGAESLVVHARTRDEGYRPPAHWEWIARVRAALTIPVVANGEVWTVDDYLRCRAVTGCDDVMIGRGAVADPFLARRIKAGEGTPRREEEWAELLPLLGVFWELVQQRVLRAHAPGRMKLWLNALRGNYVGAEALYWAVRPLRSPEEVQSMLARHGVRWPGDCAPRAH